MASTSSTRKNNSPAGRGQSAVLDLETRTHKGDHRALRLWLRLLSCTVRIETKVRLLLRREFSTTLPRFDLMAQLERCPGGLRMNELSKRLMVSGGNVTGITDQLEREGLVVRMAYPGDRRAFTVKLTTHGLKRFREMAARHEQWIIEMLGGLNRDEQQSMIDVLWKAKAHIQRDVSAIKNPTADLRG
ncbi:MAG TPA: MarR family transcriptional regulator [Candidatus Saccharimonadales bacterium]|jgi:DNA-binding MarR family transcriptional regulator|nr:MarR family transcriptional regulator [Candidatus Saccharimonadales bacterium]